MMEEIQIGEFVIIRTKKGFFWITDKSGEGMEIAEDILESAIKDFYLKHF